MIEMHSRLLTMLLIPIRISCVLISERNCCRDTEAGKSYIQTMHVMFNVRQPNEFCVCELKPHIEYEYIPKKCDIS